MQTRSTSRRGHRVLPWLERTTNAEMGAGAELQALSRVHSSRMTQDLQVSSRTLERRRRSRRRHGGRATHDGRSASPPARSFERPRRRSATVFRPSSGRWAQGNAAATGHFGHRRNGRPWVSPLSSRNSTSIHHPLSHLACSSLLTLPRSARRLCCKPPPALLTVCTILLRRTLLGTSGSSIESCVSRAWLSKVDPSISHRPPSIARP